jgi:hypothetical protein
MLALDATTRSEYDAEVTAADAAQAVVDALADPVTVRIYDGDGNVKASGTMGTPWATQAAGVVTIGEVSSFAITAAGAPDPSWYLRFESGSRWLHGSFGLRGEAADFVLSSDSWINGYTIRLGTVVVNAPSNTAPTLVGAPSSLSFTTGAGGTYDFGQHGSDPDADVLTYSLVGTSYTGITLSSSGLLTVTTTAATAVRRLTIRVTDSGGLSSDHVCDVTIGALKWYPGHYAAPDAVLFSTSLAAHTTLWNQIGSVSNFVGGEMYVPWGQIEPTTAGNYTFDLIEGQIAALAALGKKAIINVWAHRYGTTSTGGGYHPQYLIDSGDVVGGTVDGTSASEACMWRSYVADRYMALFAAMAARYDNDERVAAINTAETAFLALSDYSGSALLTQWQRIAAYMPTVFTRTPVFVKANFLTTQTQMATLMQSCVDAGAGMGGPDMFPIEFSGTTDNWGQRCLRGERYSGSAWVPGVAANQQAIIPVLMEQQVVRSTTATPAMFYNSAVTRYSCTHVTWQAKSTAFLYGSGGATPVPAMNWSNVLAYVRDNSVPLRTTIPTALA